MGLTLPEFVIIFGRTITLYVINTLDQDVDVQVKGNRVKSTDNAADVGNSFTVASGTADYQSLVPEQSGITPYVYVELSCATAPTSGNVTVYQLEGGNVEKMMVDTLAIRDTDTHDPSTDSEMNILSWWW